MAARCGRGRLPDLRRAGAEDDVEVERRRTAPNRGGNSSEEAFRLVLPMHHPCHCLCPVSAITLAEGLKFTAKPHLKNQGSQSVQLFLRWERWKLCNVV